MTEPVLLTGSRIPQAVDVQSQRPATVSPVRVYSREDLEQTGRVGVAAGLRAIDPSVGR
jgi:hypothetical protein